MKKSILHYLHLVDQYLLQPGADNAKQAGVPVIHFVNDFCTTGNPSLSLPPPQAELISPSPWFVSDLQQQLRMIHDLTQAPNHQTLCIVVLLDKFNVLHIIIYKKVIGSWIP